jgi:hypothetical protein
MGSCISGNGTTYITKRKSNNNKNKKSAGCFTSLCKGEDDIDIDNKNSSEIVPIPQIKSSYCFHHNSDKLNTDLNILIDKYKDKLKIQKINYEQIYNIFMNYTYDFTRCNFIMCDTRELSTERIQLFIKKFPQINYNIKQLMKKEKMAKMLNFLKNKNIIFILKDETSLDILEKFIIIFLANEINVSIQSIYILSQFIQKYSETNTDNASNIYINYLYYFIDEDLLYDYSPKILINSSDIKSSSINYNNNLNNAYIFFDTFSSNELKNKNNNNLKIINKFDINYLNNKNVLEKDIFLNFISNFKIEYILNFLNLTESNNIINRKNVKYIIHNEGKRNKTTKEDKKTTIKQKIIYIPKNIEFDEFYKIIHNDFVPLIEEFKDQIVKNNCILIQFDNSIDNLFMLKLIYIIIFRITGLTFDNIYSYLKCNFFELSNETFIKVKKNEILNFLV